LDESRVRGGTQIKNFIKKERSGKWGHRKGEDGEELGGGGGWGLTLAGIGKRVDGTETTQGKKRGGRRRQSKTKEGWP